MRKKRYVRMNAMADVKWIKIAVDIFDDEKMILISDLPKGDSIMIVWIKLLCLAGKMNNNGVFALSNGLAYTDKMLAAVLKCKISTVKTALQAFEQFGMIEVIDGVITIPNWNKHQSLDSYEKKKERDKMYQRGRREEQKEKIADVRRLSDDYMTTQSSMSDDCQTTQSSYVAVSEENKKENKIKNSVCVNNNINNAPGSLHPSGGSTHTDIDIPSNGLNTGITPMTDAEYHELIRIYGKDFVDEKIERAKQYKNAFNFKTIKKWCEEDYKNNKKTSKKSQNRFNNFSQRDDVDMNAMEFALLKNSGLISEEKG
nr:MAG TPA: replisome organizer [Caudoviricetes sp.]